MAFGFVILSFRLEARHARRLLVR